LYFPDDVKTVLARKVDIEGDKCPRVTADLFKHTVSPARHADQDGRKGFLKELLQTISNDRMIVHKEGLFLTHSVQDGGRLEEIFFMVMAS